MEAPLKKRKGSGYRELLLLPELRCLSTLWNARGLSRVSASKKRNGSAGDTGQAVSAVPLS